MIIINNPVETRTSTRVNPVEFAERLFNGVKADLLLWKYLEIL